MDAGVDSIATSVLWATQSGRAKACARRTLRLLQLQQQQQQKPSPTGASNESSSKSSALDDNSPNRGIQDCCAFDDIDFLSLGRGASSSDNDTDRLLILFVSTTGDAELPSDIQSTWSRLLSKSTFPPSSPSSSSAYFANVAFALFALGDRSYGPDAFCAAGRKLAARLVQLGAAPICKLGYGDDGSPNGGVFADLDIWLEEELFPVLWTSDTLNNAELNTATMSAGGGEEDGDEVVGEEYIITKQNIQQQYHQDKFTGQEDGCHLPYRVEVITKQNNTLETAGDADNATVAEQVEWQRPEYKQYYGDYFMQLRPASSYQYTHELVRTIPTQHRQSQKPDIIQHRSCDAPLLGRVVINDRITANDWIQDTRHIRIHVMGLADTTMRNNSLSTQPTTSEENHSLDNRLNLPYLAGDVATILPRNPAQMVRQFLMVLPPSIRQLADETLHISKISNQIGSISPMNNHLWPQVCTLRGLLTHCADIQSPPEREDLFALSSYCNLNHQYGMDQRAKLIALSEPAGASLYGDYIVREKRNWFDVFYDFDSLRCTAATTTKEKEEDTNDKGEKRFVHMTIDHLLALLPSIAPRHFSIASSPSYLNHELQQPSTSPSTDGNSCNKVREGFALELCVAVVQGTTLLGRPYTGCCSKYLSSIVPNNNSSEARTEIVDASSSNAITKESDIVCLWIYPGSFSKLPLLQVQDHKSSSPVGKGRHRYFDTPVMCIGAGTGIAPLRSLIFEREYQIQQMLSNSDTSMSLSSNEYVECVADTASSDDLDNILVFGCRKLTSDYYYGHEWLTLMNNKRLRLIPAFSRDQVRGKLYVQRALREADGGNLIATHILDRHGAVYVAGGSKMARAVKDEIVIALGARLDGGEWEAKKYLNKLKRLGLFSIEAWS